LTRGGIAYHPYPQSLFHAATWNDAKDTFNFDTPKIPPKNIEVLDAHLHQPRFLYQRKTLRQVMLSEQGFHKNDYSESAQRLQADATAFAKEIIGVQDFSEIPYRGRIAADSAK
jgi:hypothetical protein